MAKIFKYRGKTIEELQAMGLTEFSALLPARARRSLKRGFTEEQKLLLKKIEEFKSGKRKKVVKTHVRDLIVLPSMAGVRLLVHAGKEFQQVDVNSEMIGHYLGEFTRTRKEVIHKAPGVGATRSTKHVSVK